MTMSNNHMKLSFSSVSQNESFARVVVGAFATQLNPTIEEISDIKTAVSEAVTNAIIHGYEYDIGEVEIEVTLTGNTVEILVSDTGAGIDDIERAREPFFTSKPEMDRSGMGFTVMETFMDSIEVICGAEKGTCVRMKKTINGANTVSDE